MLNTAFERNIKALDFSFREDNEQGGILLTDNYLKRDSTISPHELFALETAKEKFGADAVYFRYFNDGRESVPQIYIYDNTSNHLTQSDQKRIHVKVWSGCQVPMFIIIDKTDVKVFDAREKVDYNVDDLAFETIKLAGTAVHQFSAKSFDDGLFWEEKSNEQHFQFSTSAYRDLITGLKDVYNSFQKISGLNNHIALKLLVQCLLIKYLEDRDEQSETGYFNKTYFKKNFSRDNFCDVIRAGKLLNLLDKLSEDFNGKVFEWNIESEQQERKTILHSNVQKLADYLDGTVDENQQLVIWRRYSFSHLPVELISSVYEELLTNSKDIVYTPEMIVSTLVDECMPLRSPRKNFKVIDVSCGSGIFLVKAYKRIIQWWRYEKWKETGLLIKPSLSELKQMLTSSVYGLDIEEDAIRLTVFSLALALLDEVNLDPPTWQKLKFPDLSESNILTKNFFEFITTSPPSDFDLVIGNPPFNLQPENGREPDRRNYFSSIKKLYGYHSDVKIPDNNPALHFLVKAPELLKPNSLLCFIQPSGPLLYQKDEQFKKELFSKYNLLQILDFTKLSDVLWGKRNIATAAIFLQNSVPNNDDVAHIIANRTFSNIHRLFLDLDYYDFHSVSKLSAIDNKHVWKSNLMGGGRLTSFIDRLSNLRTIDKFIKSNENKGWKAGEGFIASEKGVKCDYITGKKLLPTKAFTERGIDWSQTQICLTEKFHRPTNKKIYSPPHILLKANVGKEKLLSFLSEEYLVFKDKIIGIHSPEEDKQELQKLQSYFIEYSTILRFYIACTSGQMSINRATALIKDDLMNLPYPEDLTELKASVSEKVLINVVLKYFLIDSIDLAKNCTIPQLHEYSELFCETLNSVYKYEDKAFYLFKILITDKYFALHFEYSGSKFQTLFEETSDLEKYIYKIIPTEKASNENTHRQRVFKVFGKDTIIVAKPKQLRYWLQSIALRDADETFADYIKARY